MSQLGYEQTPYQTGPGRNDLGEIAKNLALKSDSGEKLFMNMNEYNAQEQFYNNQQKQPKMKDLNLTPIADRVIIKPDPIEEQTKSGIHIPENARERPMCGTVVARGPGRYAEDGTLIPMQTKVGDKVLYSPFAPSDFPYEGKDLLVIREQDLFCIVTKEG